MTYFSNPLLFTSLHRPTQSPIHNEQSDAQSKDVRPGNMRVVSDFDPTSETSNKLPPPVLASAAACCACADDPVDAFGVAVAR